MLLGCYRTGEANDPDVYVAAIVRVLSGYPIDVVRDAVDPLHGIPSRVEWLPKPHEVKRELDALYLPVLRRREWDDRTEAQLAEREQRDAELGPSASAIERVRRDMAAAGMPILADREAARARKSSRPWSRYTHDELRNLYLSASRETPESAA